MPLPSVCVCVVRDFRSACFRVEFQATQRGEQPLAAVWSEKGQVEIFDLRPQLEAVHSSAAMAAFTSRQKEATSLFSFSGHMSEGFAIDWSPTVAGGWILEWCELIWYVPASDSNKGACAQLTTTVSTSGENETDLVSLMSVPVDRSSRERRLQEEHPRVGAARRRDLVAD